MRLCLMQMVNLFLITGLAISLGNSNNATVADPEFVSLIEEEWKKLQQNQIFHYCQVVFLI